MNENNYNENELDFQKMNATLANPDFANWYYNRFVNSDKKLNINEFIDIIGIYNQETIN